VLLALAVALVAKGALQLLLVPGTGYDLLLRWTSTHYYLRGVNPFEVSFYFDDVMRGAALRVPPAYFADLGRAMQENYPPTSTLTQILLFGLPLRFTWAYYLILNVLGCAIVAWWAVVAHPVARRSRMILAGVALANLGYSQTIINGNYGVIVMAALVGAIHLRTRLPLLAGVLMGVALVKPTVSAPFLLLFLAEREYRVMVSCVVYLAVSVALAMVLTGDGVVTLFRQALEGTTRFAVDGYALWQVLRAWGLGHATALFVNAVVFLVPLAALVRRNAGGGAAFQLPVLAATAVVARLFTYHNSVDNVLVTFLALALAQRTLLAPESRAATVLAGAVTVSVLIPFAATDSVAAHVALYAIWSGATLYVTEVR
jgi:hypothetical protein